MRKLICTALLAATINGSFGQGFWAPGAIWFFEDSFWNYAERFTYIGDSVVGGLNAQVCLYEQCQDLGSGVYDCDNMMAPFYEFTSIQGEALLGRHHPYFAFWDTLYWLGVPGDRWWPINADESCAPQGMIEIQDTGHVDVAGLNLRFWTIAYLNAAGTTNPGTSTIYERLGSTPRQPYYDVCDPQVIEDWGQMELSCYRDDEFPLFIGENCDLSTSADQRQSAGDPMLLPNPGSDQLWITGLHGRATIEVHDALGGDILPAAPFKNGGSIPTSTWNPGTYFITITSSDGARQVLRWVKQ